jgi:DNA-binding beta-propeller fold protein YncE
VSLVIFLVASPAAIAATNETNIIFGRSWPLSVAIDSGRGVAYIDVESGDYPPTGFSFGVINSTSETVERTLGLPGEPGQIALDEATGRVYVASTSSINVYDWKTNSFGTPLDVGLPIFGMVFDNVSNDLVFTSGNSVYKVDPSTGAIIGSAGAGVSAQGIAIDWVNGEMYVADYLSASVSVFRESNLALVKTIHLPTPAYPSKLVFDRELGEVFVTTDESAIVVLSASTDSLVQTLGLTAAGQESVSAISLDEREGLVFVASNPGSLVTEVDATNGQVVSSFAVNSTVYQMAFDGTTDKLFATNYHQITVITPAHPNAYSPLLIIAAVVGLACCVAAAVAVYSRIVTASGGRRGGPPSQPQTPLSS